MSQGSSLDSFEYEQEQEHEQEDEQERDQIICPVCGATCIQQRCKVVCESEKCRGRVVLNCSEF